MPNNTHGGGRDEPDLTRWNRAGLKRVRYVDGNAATYLEALRQELCARLAGWDMGLLAAGDDRQKALENYLNLNDRRADIALEIIRSFARATHVLTEHLDAYANEGFLGTATQWENIRRLVCGLDYHPKPPASAMTHLVLHAKPEQSGLVARGLQVKHTPEGGSPVIFETLDDIQVDPALNALKLKDWDRPQDTVNIGNDSDSQLTLGGIVEGLKPGDPVIIDNKKDLLPCLLKSAVIEGKSTVLYLDLPANKDLGPRSDVTVYLKPVEMLEVYGPVKQQVLEAKESSLILKEAPVSLSKEDVVFIGKGKKGVYRIVSEVGVESRQVDLAPGTGRQLSEEDDYVGKPEKLDVRKETISSNNTLEKILKTIKGAEGIFVDNRVIVLGDRTWLKDGDILVRTAGGSNIPCKVSDVEPEATTTELATKATTTELTLLGSGPIPSSITQILLPPSGNEWKWEIDSFVNMDEASLEVGIVQRMTCGDLCVIACDENLIAAQVKILEKTGTDRFGLKVYNRQPTALVKSENFILSKTVIFGNFTKQLPLEKSNVNGDSISGTSLKLESTEAAKGLKIGKPLVIEPEAGKSGKGFLTSVKSVDIQNGEVTLDSALPEGYTVGDTVIRANVALAGHGETQPERILGSGNATLSNQEFLFPVAGVSFVSDEAQVSGVRADIRVIVDGETWTQVPRFNQSRPADPHYTVRMTEEGYLRIMFGDGVNGRRLPTGENNVRIGWRMGSGTVGNLKAGSLKKLAYPHPRVEAVDQPASCAGGNDMESVTSLKRSAPASLSTMERAVSVKDFAELTASHSSTWNAHAELETLKTVRVTVVPAQGGKLSESGSLSKTLKAFLLSHAIPGVQVELDDFESEILKLDITLGINSARFDPEVVKAEVRKVLLQSFTLKNRGIGAPVYLSDVYQRVEAVRGVEYSICKFVIEGEISEKQFLYPKDSHKGVLHMEHEDDIKLTLQEAQK
jgi:hypothetical protein